MTTGPPLPESFANGRFQVTALLGEGGFARVYRVTDVALGVERALKVLTVSVGHREDVRRRLRSEARAMAQIDHPNILRVHDVGTDNDLEYVVMELAEGGSLDELLARDGRMDPRVAVSLCLQILSALGAAHAKGIIHRDVKPNNILLDRKGTPLLADFGIARLSEGASHHATRAGAAMGTLLYMAPEQRVDARSVGPAADIYAMAATLYILTTGRSPADLFAVKVESERWTSVPEPLRAPLRKALSYEVAARYDSTVAFARDLSEALPALGNFAFTPAPAVPSAITFFATDTQASLFPGAAPPASPSKSGGRIRIAAAVATGLLLAVGAVTAWWVRPPPPGPAVATPAPPPDLPAEVGVAPTAPVVATPAPAAAPAPVALPPTPRAPSPALEELSGAWSGSLAGRSARLTLSGTAREAVGALTVTFFDSAIHSQVVGSWNAEDRRLILTDVEDAEDAGTYTLTLSPDGTDLVGQFSARHRTQVVPVRLHR